MAGLGLTVAILAGHPVQSDAGYWYALAFAGAGALLFAWLRAFERSIQPEAVIGIVYAVSASLAVLALDRAPQGAEHIKQLLIGSILTVTPQDVRAVAMLYALIGIIHLACRRALVRASFDPQASGRGLHRVFLWDIVFYASFALVVTSSVRLAGVLVVFAYLIVPAALAGVLTPRLGRRLLLAWAIGVLGTAAGIYASWLWDLPTGPAIVTAFGAAAAGLGLFFVAMRQSWRSFARALLVGAAVVGVLLVLFPYMDQPWLDALESAAPPVQTVFLTDDERATRSDMLQSIARSKIEVTRLREIEQDVRWGSKEMDPDKAERLRQYLAGRSEISAGEQLVLRHLRDQARERQRLLLGLPLVIIGVGGVYRLRRATPITPHQSEPIDASRIAQPPETSREDG